jgi:hypothetical protein
MYPGMQNLILTHLCLLLLLNLTSCKEGATEKVNDNPPESQNVIGVSVWDRISSRNEPMRSSARGTLLSLGERFLYLDSSAIDTAYNNTRFLYVQLSDSSRVWVYDFASVLNARPGVMMNSVPLYLRPDLLTITDQELSTMEIIAVVEEWDDGIKVVNEKKEHVGWIKQQYVTYEPIDLAFAILVKRRLEKEDPEQKIEGLEELLEHNPYPETIFIQEVRERLEEEKDQLRHSDDDRDRNRDDRNRRNRD